MTFYKTQKLLNGKIKRKHNPNRSEDFPLRKFLVCSICEKHLTGSWSKGRNKKYAYYHCVTKGCNYKPIPKFKAENIFIQYLQKLIPEEEKLEKFFKFLKKHPKKRKKIRKWS